MRRGWKILIGVVLALVVLLVVADRVGAVVAENAAESRLAENAQFAGSPSVDVHGVPFLTQAIRGSYDDVEVAGRLRQLGDISGASLDVNLRGAQVPLGRLIARDVQDLPVDQVDGTVTIPYSELARLSKIPGLTITPNGSKLDASATLTVPVLGDDVTVTGEGVVTLVDGQIKLMITQLKAGSVTIPSALLPAVSAAVTALIPVPDLPYGLQLTSAKPGSDGLEVAGAAHNVVLRKTAN